jgi:acetyl esterase/lipase
VWVPEGDDLAVRPLMIFQFGGGFRFGDRNQLAGLARSAAHRGFVTAAFDYRTGTGWQDEGLLPGVRDDAGDAVAWLTERADELGFDPDAIISTGASAGAVNSIHLITMEPDQGDVVLAGVVSLSGANLTGKEPAAGGPPIIMFSGTQDTIVPFRLQTRFCEQYVAAGNVCEQHVYDAGHMGGDQADIKAKSIAFVREQILRPLGY